MGNAKEEKQRGRDPIISKKKNELFSGKQK
jgi:hypothetical protein